MSNKLELPDDRELAKVIITNNHEIEKKKTQNGILGNFWGDSQSVPNNIAALFLISLLLFGVIRSFCCKDIEELKTIWAVITPMITLALGYLFGDKKGKGGDNT